MAALKGLGKALQEPVETARVLPAQASTFKRTAVLMMTFSLLMDPQDEAAFEKFLDGGATRAEKSEIRNILKSHLEPLVQFEKSFLSSHSKSGALEMSLSARSGTGDRAGTISVFAAPTATHAQLLVTWGRGRGQQRQWAAGISGKGRKRVFYGPIVHQGHRIVVRDASGQLRDTGLTTKAVPFAQQAVDALGDSESEEASVDIMKYILGE